VKRTTHAKPRQAAGFVVCALVAAISAGCANQVDTALPATAVASTPSVVLPTPIPTPFLSNDTPGELSGEVVTALLSVRDAAPALYPANYAGIASGTAASKDMLVIYLADSTPAIEAELLAMSGLPADKIVFEPAYQSLEAAGVIDRRIMAGVPALRTQGIDLQTFGVGVDGVEDIGMDDPTDEQIAYLFEQYGPYLRIDRNVTPARLL
jgi:hypothetical protein